ncbi:guanylate kinase [Myxococcota bacterium]|nr:guanylate kinase [Myxococcota bacterium]
MSGNQRGIPVVLAAPSGAGKTSVCRRLLEFDDHVELSVSHTTRDPRAGEQDGVHYHFVDEQAFEKMARDGEFLEWAVYNGNHYGTSWAALRDLLGSGVDALLEIEVQGARQVRHQLDDARFVFILPPSLEVLRSRLTGRGTDDPDQIEGRLGIARGEIEAVAEFDYAIVNDELDRCVEDLRSILYAERRGQTDELKTRFNPRAVLQRFRYDFPSD